MDYLLVFHSNLNYGWLAPDRYPEVCERSYLALLDFFGRRYRGAKWTLEMSGFTVDTLCRLYPEAPGLVRAALEHGAEAATGPYAHSILPNFPPEHAEQALRFSLRSWQERLGVRPSVGWVPECAWAQRLPAQYSAQGLTTLVADFDSHLQTREGKRVPRTYSHKPEAIDLHLPMDPADPDLHTALATPGGRAVVRSDRVAMRALKYLQGDAELADLTAAVDRYSRGDGHLVVYACDTEYLGTTAWYWLRERGVQSVFSPAPETFDRLARLVDLLSARGNLLTVSEAAAAHPALPGRELNIADGLAWHHGEAGQWDTTPESRELNRACRETGERLLAAAARGADPARLERAWWHLVQAESSDGGYPLPPLRPAPGNIGYCREHLARAGELAVGALAAASLTS